MDIRKTVTIIEDVLIEGRAALAQPQRRVATIAVVRNPLVGNGLSDLSELVQDGGDLGRYLAERALDYIDRSRITMIGKAAIVGVDGEVEQGQAILYPKFTNAVRDTLEVSATNIPGEKKLARVGSPIEVLLWSVNAPPSDPPAGQMELRIPDSPQRDEILVALVIAGTAGSK